jgi:serine/threonine-protein kinase
MVKSGGADDSDPLAETKRLEGAQPLWTPGGVLDGEYRVERVLGEGGMGIVVAARELRTDELVAIKLIKPERTGDPASIKRFLREARITLQLKSERAVRVLRVGQLKSGMPYLVMEYLHGRTVASLLEERGALPTETGVDYLLQACEAVAEAHALGVVHRDLKPSNLFLARGPDGTDGIKVIDFGISKLTTGEGLAGDDGQLTTTAVPLGSPRYMSPEQLGAARDVDARTDIWALGIILCELVTGSCPFHSDSVADLCARILRDAPPPLASLGTSVPAGMDALYRRCLAKEPAQRIASVSDFAVALAPFGSAASQTSLQRILTTAPAGATTMPRAPRVGLWRRRLVLAAALIGAAAVAAIGAYALATRAARERREPPAVVDTRPVPAVPAAAPAGPAAPPPTTTTPPPPAEASAPAVPAPAAAKPARAPRHRPAPPRQAPAAEPRDEDLFDTRR